MQGERRAFQRPDVYALKQVRKSHYRAYRGGKAKSIRIFCTMTTLSTDSGLVDTTTTTIIIVAHSPQHHPASGRFINIMRHYAPTTGLVQNLAEKGRRPVWCDVHVCMYVCIYRFRSRAFSKLVKVFPIVPGSWISTI